MPRYLFVCTERFFVAVSDQYSAISSFGPAERPIVERRQIVVKLIADR